MLLHLIKRGALPPLRRGCSSVAPSSLSLRPIVPSELSDATIGAIPPSRIRNFCIIAHVDHGKSTLADRLMQLAGNISSEKMGEGQVLDKLQVERERGITVKSQTVSMFYDGIGGIGDGDGDGDRDGDNEGGGGGDGGSGSGEEGGGDGRYMLNLIDTPGHVDFSSEVAQSLLACQGALLLVDASQGVQAQTLATYNSAVAAGIDIIPVLTKTDLPHSNPERAIDQLFMAMDVDPDFVIQTSAKSGIGVDLLPAAIVEQLPPPPAAAVTAASVAAFLSEHPASASSASASSASSASASSFSPSSSERSISSMVNAMPFEGRIIDTWMDPFRGVVILCAVHCGKVTRGSRVQVGDAECDVLECGFFLPQPRRMEGGLTAGHVGYLVTTMKAPSDVILGAVLREPSSGVTAAVAKENVLGKDNGGDGDSGSGSGSDSDDNGFDNNGDAPSVLMPSLEGGTPSPAKAMVFASVFPVDSGKFSDVRDNVDRLALNDSGVSVHVESSDALGMGLSVGFLGMLHMDVFLQRLQQEYGTPVITTAPAVPVTVVVDRNDHTERIVVCRPSDMPDPNDIVECYEEMVLVTIVMPDKYMGSVIGEMADRGGEVRSTSYLDTTTVVLKYGMPWQEVVLDFYDVVKSLTSGYASFDYEPEPPRLANMVKVSILLNRVPVDELSFIAPRDKATSRAKDIAKRLKGAIKRHQFEVIIQGAIGSKVRVFKLELNDEYAPSPCAGVNPPLVFAWSCVFSRCLVLPLALQHVRPRGHLQSDCPSAIPGLLLHPPPALLNVIALTLHSPETCNVYRVPCTVQVLCRERVPPFMKNVLMKSGKTVGGGKSRSLLDPIENKYSFMHSYNVNTRFAHVVYPHLRAI